MQNANSIILAHNHRQDDVTQVEKMFHLIYTKIAGGGDILGIEVLDHLIIVQAGRYRKVSKKKQNYFKEEL